MSEKSDSLSIFRQIAILIAVVLSATLYATTILIVSTILPQMQGTLSATDDEISWVMTFNILATAVVTPMTGWLVAKMGSRAVMVWSVAGFTLSTYFCGAATSLETLIFWRVIQGGISAPITPLAQSIILDNFPKRRHGAAIGLFGMGVMCGAFIGPTFGGVIADLYTWRWSFYLLVPMSIAAVFMLIVA
ncbi:MAG: MFS transporter, partial [Methyloligellaceae bacterium]